MNALLATAAASYGRTKLPVDPQFEDLFDGVDDLIKRVADTENPEIRRIRAKVHASMMVAKSACEDRTQRRASAPLGDADADPMDEEYPGETLGVALLVGLGLGVIMSMQP